MTHEPDNDMNHARRFLLMDDREWANARAEMAKRAGRRAIQRGDMGSPIEPISFAPHSPDDAPSAKLAQDDAVEEAYHCGLLHGFLGAVLFVVVVTGCVLWKVMV